MTYGVESNSVSSILISRFLVKLQKLAHKDIAILEPRSGDDSMGADLRFASHLASTDEGALQDEMHDDMEGYTTGVVVECEP